MRSHIEIIAIILSSAEYGERKTRLLYKSNLSHQRLNIYLNSLLEIGLLKERRKNGYKIYITTNKGREFLSNFRQLTNLDLYFSYLKRRFKKCSGGKE